MKCNHSYLRNRGGYKHSTRRRAVSVVVVAVSIPVLLGFAALTVDVAVLYNTRADLQRCADACAMAAAAGYSEATGDISERLVAGRQAAHNYAEENSIIGGSISLASNSDIVYGNAEFNEAGTAITFTPTEDNPNAVRILARRTSDSGNGAVNLLFSRIFGMHATDVSAQATAGLNPPLTADLVPTSLRTPGFGPVDPDIVDQNPGKEGPSEPANGEYFEIGEEVTVFLFGKGPRPPVHLVLDLEESNGNSDIQKILGGTEPPIPITIGQEMPIVNNGSGNGVFGQKLADRLEDFDDANDIIVIPIITTLPESRNGDGQLTGDIKIVDFATVRLTEIREEEVPDPKKEGKTMTIEVLYGEIVQGGRGYGNGLGTTSGMFTDDSVAGQVMLLE